MSVTGLRVESFPASELVDAHYAAIDPAIDLVIVRDLPGQLEDRKRRGINYHLDAIDLLRSLTPMIGAFWRQNRYRWSSNKVEFQRGPAQDLGVHVDSSQLRAVGYTASYNAGEEDRRFWATRRGVPSTTNSFGFIHRDNLRDLAEQLKFCPKPETSEMEVIHPGDFALFGALPRPAIHYGEGDTRAAFIIDWKTPRL